MIMTTITSQPGGPMPPLFAGTRPPLFTAQQVVSRFDADASGGISFAEVEASRAGTKVDEALFAKIDGDTDGQVTASEWESFRASADFRSDMGLPERPGRGAGLTEVRSLIQSLIQSGIGSGAVGASASGLAEAGYAEAQNALNPAI
jgi:hypothetical protein